MLRGLLGEFGIVIAQGIGSAIKFAKSVLDGDKPGIPEVAIDVLANLSNQLVALHLRVRWYEMRMKLQAKQDERALQAAHCITEGETEHTRQQDH